MEAGPELDALVAEKVMGWRLEGVRWHAAGGFTGFANESGYGDYYHPDPVWSPSTDISAAWQVVEKMEITPFVWRCPNPEEDRPQPGSGLTLRRSKDGWTAAFHLRRGIGIGATAPLAICLAALSAVTGTIPKD